MTNQGDKQKNSTHFFFFLRVFFESYGAELIIALGTIILTLTGILTTTQKGWDWIYSKNYGIAFIIGSLLSITGTLISVRQAPRKKQLLDEVRFLQEELNNQRQQHLEELNIQRNLLEDEIKNKSHSHVKILADEIRVLFEVLQLTNNERISLYRNDRQAFNQIARYSPNPRFRVTGRGVYPINQGCIGHAWENKEIFDNNLGDIDELYFATQKERWNISANVAKNLTMKSKAIGAFAIDDTENGRVAVIVFESTNVDGLNWDNIKNKMLQGAEEKRIELLLRRISITPEFMYALKEGF